MKDGLQKRRFEGVGNILRFNWHFYAIAATILTAIVLFNIYLPLGYNLILFAAIGAGVAVMMISLLVSMYVYDFSDLYKFKYLGKLEGIKILNVHAGFDEVGTFLTANATGADITTADFYNAEEHTEISIKRARNYRPPSADTISVSATNLPFEDGQFDKVICVLSAHEIRRDGEREKFFEELRRVVNDEAEIHVVEHLRDLPNFLAYTLGAFHFYSKETWLTCFDSASLQVVGEEKITNFVSAFRLKKK